MNIEKTECNRLGYEYTSLLVHIASLCHHTPFIKDYITEEAIKKFDDLCLKLAKGDCEIIEFKRTLCRYNFTDVLKEKDDKIEQLQSNWNSLREWIEKQKEDSKTCKEWNNKKGFNDIDYDRDIKRFDFILDKMNELEGNDKE